MNRILVMHGVNLNLFGKRDPKHYGTETLEDINGKLSALAGELGVEVSFFQSNYEGAFVERIQEAHGDGTAGIVLNAILPGNDYVFGADDEGNGSGNMGTYGEGAEKKD